MQRKRGGSEQKPERWMVSPSDGNRAEEVERQREAKSAHVAFIRARLFLGSCVSRLIARAPKLLRGSRSLGTFFLLVHKLERLW
jgi:hypothetical protein